MSSRWWLTSQVGGRLVDPKLSPTWSRPWQTQTLASQNSWDLRFLFWAYHWKLKESMFHDFQFFLSTKWMNRTFYKFYLYVALASLITKKDLNKWNLNISFESQHDTQDNVQVEDLLHLANHNRCGFPSSDWFPAFFWKKSTTLGLGRSFIQLPFGSNTYLNKHWRSSFVPFSKSSPLWLPIGRRWTALFGKLC